MKCPICESVDFIVIQADIFSALAECMDCGIRSVVRYAPYPTDPELDPDYFQDDSDLD